MCKVAAFMVEEPECNFWLCLVKSCVVVKWENEQWRVEVVVNYLMIKVVEKDA